MSDVDGSTDSVFVLTVLSSCRLLVHMYNDSMKILNFVVGYQSSAAIFINSNDRSSCNGEFFVISFVLTLITASHYVA